MADESPLASVSLEIERGRDVVVDQFFDVDHAIRAKIHHGMTLSWLPASRPGEHRVRQEMPVLTSVQTDDFVIERGEPDTVGAWVKRFVGGPNVGTRIVGEFTEVDAGKTRVRLQAFVPRGGFAFGFGKLSQLGMEKHLHKFLQEHRTSLQGYEPGRARGAIQNALEACRDLTSSLVTLPADERRAVGSNLLEAAYVVAVSDGEADDAERDALRAIARVLCFVDLDEAGCDKMVVSVTDALKRQGIEQRCEKVGARLKAMNMASLGVAVGALVAQVSHGIDPQELAVIGLLAKSGGVSETEWTALLRKIDDALSARR